MEIPEEVQTEIADNNEAVAPDEPVVGEAGEETPQASSEVEEFEIDLGDDDEQESSKASAQVPVYKLNKLRKRAQKAEKRESDATTENEALRAELEGLRSDVAVVRAGPRPDPYDFDSTEQFREADDKYNATVSGKAPAQATPAQNQRPAIQANDAFFDTHYEEASKLKLKAGEFQEAEGNFREQFNDAFGDNGQLLADLVLQEAGDKSPLVSLALGKNGNETQKLIKALSDDAKNGTNTSVKLIWKLSEKVVLKLKRNRVATDPTDIPKGASNAGSLSDKISKAHEEWKEKPTVANSRKLNDLRKQSNG